MEAARETDMRNLHAGLMRRPRPEDVASVVLRVVGDQLTEDERRVVEKAARHAEQVSWWSHQSDDWALPVSAETQIATLATLAARAGVDTTGLAACDTTDAGAVRAFASEIAASVSHWDAVAPQGRDARVAHGVPSARVRDRLRRQIAHVLTKAEHLDRATTKRHLAIVGRAGLVSGLDFETFAASKTTAAFVAYYAARRNLRRMFTLHGKENAFDDVANALWSAMERTNPNWEIVARVYSAPRVTAQLDTASLMRVAAAWWNEMTTAANLASTCAGVESIRRDTMGVFRGMDSETWNLAAQGYNEARSAWFSALDAAGALDLTTPAICPPKLPRLMAGDLVAWHLNTGGQRDPDTLVAAMLPWPWDVVNGAATCTAADVIDACRTAGVDPTARGWVGPRAPRPAAEFTPTPELVHGVVVGDPILAALLRKAGVFSAKNVDWELVAAFENVNFDFGPER